MKKLFVCLFIAVIALPALNAQFTKIGGGVGYGTGYWFHKNDFYDYNRSGHIAGFLEGIYEITVPLHVTGRISYFYPHVTKDYEKVTVSSMMFDINGHYVFNSLDRLEFYGLAGLDFLLTWKKTKYESAMSEPITENDNAIGLNLGAGACFKITNQFDLFAEAKYIVSKYSQFMANTGILINIDWMKKHENDPK